MTAARPVSVARRLATEAAQLEAEAEYLAGELSPTHGAVLALVTEAAALRRRAFVVRKLGEVRR